MILSFWQYIHGYVIIKISGFAPERFMNLCANKNIYIWNIKKVSDGYIFSISGKAFFMLKPIARKTRCKIKIIKKVGLPFRFYLFKKRQFFLIGFILSLSIIFTLSLFIWKIEIYGNSEYTKVEIVKFLKDNNVRIGSFKPKIKCSEIDNQLLLNFKNIIWASCELKGTTLNIYIREGLKAEKIENDKTPSDLIATKSGTIVSIITRTGTPLVKQGDKIEKGDVLVTGTLEIKELDQLKAVKFTYSDADVYIKTTYSYKDTLPIKYIEKQYIEDNKKRGFAIEIFDYKFNLFNPRINNGLYDKIETNVQLKLIDNFYLPITIYTTTYTNYYEVEKYYTKEEGENILLNNLNRQLNLLEENNIQIVDNDVKFKMNEELFIAEGEIVVIEKTGKLVPFDENVRRKEYDEFFREENGDTL